VILKPGLVIGRNAYGGTALLRMLAAFPAVSPLVHGESRIQTVAVDDVVDAVRRALRGEIASGGYDLVEPAGHGLRALVAALRAWLGLAPVKTLALPAWCAAPVAFAADFAGLLGWRSALRSTAMRVMSEGVAGDPEPWRRATGRSLKSLEETFAAMPATAQDRAFARASLALPIMICALALFWIVSGAIGLIDLGQASAHLAGHADALTAQAVVAAGSLLDMAIGGSLLIRRTAKPAALISIAVAAFYLAVGTVIAPELWLDPLGVYVKVFPAMALGLAVALMIGER